MKKEFTKDDDFNTDDIMHSLSCGQYRHLIVIREYKGRDRTKFGTLNGTAIATYNITANNIEELTDGGCEFILTDETPKLVMRLKNILNNNSRGAILSEIERMEVKKERLKWKLERLEKNYPEVLTFI